MHGNLLDVSNLYVDYISPKGKNTVLNDLTFCVPYGKVLGIAGESGSGKTTIALALLRLFSSHKAEVKGHALFKNEADTSVDLLNVPDSHLAKLRGKRISIIFQEPRSAFNPLFTCGNQIAETIRRHTGASKAESVKHAKEWLARTDLSEPENIFHSYPHQLSGGQLQRAMIAMALCCRPSLLIADEPLASSDYSNYQSLLNLLRKLKEEIGMSIIFISHDLPAIEKIADSALILHRGRLIEQGPVGKVMHSPEQAYTKRLVESRMDRMEGNKIQVKEISEQVEKVPILKVNNLKKIFKEGNAMTGVMHNKKIAVKDLTFELFHGETLGITGNSGSGKTTLARCLCGLLENDGGEIILRHRKILTDSGKSDFSTTIGKVQIIFQNPDTSLNPKQTIGEAIMEPLNYYGRQAKINDRKKNVLQLMEKAGLEKGLLERYPYQLSGGQKQRAVIVRALVMQPEVLICDEPVSALDTVIQFQVLKLLNELKQTFGFSIIFISHDGSVVKFMSDRIMVMENGSIKHIGDSETISDLLNNEETVY